MFGRWAGPDILGAELSPFKSIIDGLLFFKIISKANKTN